MIRFQEKICVQKCALLVPGIIKTFLKISGPNRESEIENDHPKKGEKGIF